MDFYHRSTALVVGISDYPNGKELPNPANDATDVSVALQELGFSVLVCTDCSGEDFDRAFSSFRDNLNSNDVGLFYYAGHAMQFEGNNYLNPKDAGFQDDSSAKYSSIPLNQIIERMASCSNKTNIIILDACRDNPYIQERHRSAVFNGLAPVHAPEGTLVAFATSPGQRAKDGIGRNGRFSEAFLKHLKTPDIPVEDFFKRVRNSLIISTNGEQISWEHTSLTGDFFFNLSPGRRMGEYGPSAISDSFFLLNSSTPVMEAISALKSHNWYTQNDALTGLMAKLEGSDIDTLFVLGRNIYQAACGGANSVIAFIKDFPTRVAGLNLSTQKAMLEGMLFEVFFNSKGELRRGFKTSKFEILFELRQVSEFEQSFALIADVLSLYQSRFHIIPGRNRPVSVDVSTTELDSGERLVKGVFLNGVNILQKTALDDLNNEDSYPVKYDKLVRQISIALLVPTYQITVTQDFETDTAKLLFPAEATLDR